MFWGHVRLFWFVQPGEYKFIWVACLKKFICHCICFPIKYITFAFVKKRCITFELLINCVSYLHVAVYASMYSLCLLIFTAMQSYRWFVSSSISEEKRKHVLHRKSAWAFHTGANNSWNLLLLSKTMASCQRISGLPAIYHYACLNQVSYGTPSRSFDLWWAMSFISCWIFGIWFFLCLAKYHWFNSCWDGFWDAYHFPFGHVCQKLFLV